MSTLDALIVAAFIVYAGLAGLSGKTRASRSLDEYFLAGRTLRGWQAGVSMAATQFAADTPLLVTGLVATAGIFALWRLWIYALAFLLLGFVLGPSWRRAGVLTDAELTELRYGGRGAAILRATKAVYFGTVFNCTVLAMVLLAAKEIAEPFLLWDQWLPTVVFEPLRSLVEAVGLSFARESGGGDVWVRSTDNILSISMIAGVALLYSATGGLRAVVRTDVVQLAIMMAATVAYAIYAVDAAGGLAQLPARLAVALHSHAHSDMTVDELLAFTPGRAWHVSGAMLTVLALQWLVQMNADGTGYLAQRTMACRSDRDAKQASVIFTVIQVVVRSLLWMPIALSLLLVFPADDGVSAAAAEREVTFVRGIAELLPSGLSGLMLTGMLAALASTVDTHLNWGASYWTNDIYKRFVCESWRGVHPSERSLVRVARLSSVLILLVSLVIMSRLGSIQTAWHASLLLGAGMGVMLVLRWLWWRVTAWGELAAVASSMVAAPLLLLTTPAHAEAERLLVVAAVSTVAGVVVSLAGGSEPAAVLSAFYSRARPPGFWQPVATALGEDGREPTRRLRCAAAAVACAAVSVFSVLVAVGTWLLGGPAPLWFPWRGLWIVVLLVTAAVAAPLSWRFASVSNPPHATS